MNIGVYDYYTSVTKARRFDLIFSREISQKIIVRKLPCDFENVYIDSTEQDIIFEDELLCNSDSDKFLKVIFRM